MFDRFITNISRTVQLTTEEAEHVQSLIVVKKLRKHQFFVQEGDVARYEAFINKGSTRSYSIDAKGNEHVVMFGVEEWWTGDMYSFLTHTPARFNIAVEEDSELLCFDKNTMESIYRDVPKFERFFRILVQNAFIAQQERIIANMSQSAEERYQQFVNRYPQFEKRFPQYQIASYLGIKPESLSRIRARRNK